MAVQEQLELLKRDIEAWNQWRQGRDDLRPDLNEANLIGASLIGANLTRANLTKVDLTRADLTKATLIQADLDRANLFGINLTGANLRRANPTRANLTGANLTKADLTETNLARADLTGANLTEADLTRANFSYTTFAWLDLSRVKGLETTIHEGPSTININSVVLPQDEYIRRDFLRNVGFSDIFIDYLPSLLTTPIQYRSLFLSYSHHDQAFTKLLYTDLQNQGVRCWFAPHNLRPGTPIVRGIEEAIHLHEKLLLILSKDAVMSNWVQQEVEAALYKEVTTGQETLFPVRLDNTVLESETPWAKRLCQRHIGDFTNWQDNAAYQRAFTTLLRHLKVTQPPTSRSASS